MSDSNFSCRSKTTTVIATVCAKTSNIHPGSCSSEYYLHLKQQKQKNGLSNKLEKILDMQILKAQAKAST